MNKDHYCDMCNISVHNSLSYCPLCGRKVGEGKKEDASYPQVDFSYTLIEKWIKIVGALLLLLSILSVVVNLFFRTNPFWFPYVIVGIFSLWRVLFYPFKEGKSHLNSIPASGIMIAILLIFIDVYDYKFIGSELGWALCYSAPAVLTLTTIVSFILAINMRKVEESLTKGIVGIGVVNLLFLLSKILWFNQFKNWPIFMSILASFVALFLLFLFKRKRLIKELNRSFHI